jgi:DNA polymerase-3 subunit epsilon
MIDETSFIDDAHDNAIKWADNILATPPGQVLILDTETTGLGADAEIIQLAMIDLGGNEIMNTLVRPKYAIPRDARAIHGITDSMVANAPFWSDIAPRFEELVKGKTLVIYNAAYDLRLLRQTYQINQIPCALPYQDVQCAMEIYAEYAGEWTGRSFRWQKLQGGDHSAVGDCRAVLSLIKSMAHQAPVDPEGNAVFWRARAEKAEYRVRSLEIANAESMRMLIELKDAKSPVTWKEKEYGDGWYVWECSGCRDEQVWEDSPEENNVKFCSHCGHPIAAFEPYKDTTPPPDDDILPSEGGK